jgi:uncharacterized protein (TIGR02270 family)
MKAELAHIPEVVWQFADDCTSLYGDRENAAVSRIFPATLMDLERVDARVDAALDGLRVSGIAAWHTVAQTLEFKEVGCIFTAAVQTFEKCAMVPSNTDEVAELLGNIEEPGLAVRPLAVALEWIDRRQLQVALEKLSSEQGPLVEAVRLSAWSDRTAPLEAIAAALESGGPGFLVCAACDAAVASGEPRSRGLIEAHLADEDHESAIAAAYAGLIAGSRRAFDAIKGVTSQPELPGGEGVVSLLFRSLEPAQAEATHHELFGRQNVTRLAIRAAGAAGIRELIPFLIEHMDCKPLARLAGESFTEITGVDLQKERLSRLAPNDVGGGPTEDPEDEATDLDLDEGRPWPDRLAVEHWWAAHSIDFRPMMRYLGGVTASEHSLKRLLFGGPQRIRTAAAELLAVRGRPLFDVRAPIFRQMQRLATEEIWR